MNEADLDAYLNEMAEHYGYADNAADADAAAYGEGI